MYLHCQVDVTYTLILRVNGHVPGLAGGGESRENQRKRKGKLTSGPRQLSGPPAVLNHPADSQKANSCNGQLKFADRLKGLQGLLLSNGDESFHNRMDHSDLSDLEDPYAFSEPEPVRRYSSSSSNMKVLTKPSGRSLVKTKIDRGNNYSSKMDNIFIFLCCIVRI